MKPRRTWFLLAGLLLVGGLTGCSGQQEQAIAAIEKLGGDVQVDDNNAVMVVGLVETQVTDADLKGLAGLTQLRALDLQGTQVTDAGLKELAGLKQLQSLALYGTKVTDAGVRELQLALPNARISR